MAVSTNYASDFRDLHLEVLGPLGRVPGARVRVEVQIDVEAPEGFDPTVVRTVSENASQLRFTESTFEE